MGVYVYKNEQLDKVAGLGYNVVDTTMSSSSENPVQNKVVKEYVDTSANAKVSKDQGVAQSGKVLGINASGMVEPVDVAGSASDITYDNSTSGLSATDVQEAVDEVDSAVDGLGSQVSTLISDTANYYNITDSTDTTLVDADYVPFYDTSASTKKRITWANIVTKIKSSLANYFGNKFLQSNGKLSLLAENNTILDTVTLSPLASNTSYTDTNSIGATNVQSAVDKMFSIFSGKFYERDIYNYSTSGTWADYTKNTIQFSLPSEAIGTGKTFMLVHHFRSKQMVDGNIESFIDTPNNSATFFSSTRFYSRMLSQVWCSYIQIVFLTSNVNPTIRINVSTSAPITNNISSWCTLVPLN